MVEKVIIKQGESIEQNVSKGRIFITQDELIVSIDIKKQLEYLGYEVVGIESTGEATIEKVLKLKPDLVLIDMTLAGELDGIDTVKKIKKKYEVLVIYITAMNSKETFDLASTTNPCAYISKPFNATKMGMSISIALQRKKNLQKLVQKKEELVKSNKILTEEKEKAQKEVETQLMMIQEFTETQEHLIAATWREREMKQKLQETLDELEESKRIIEKQNKNILDSINYAKRIQQSIIPNKDILDALLGDYFMFYKPKDVVSGDFPWIYERGEYVYIAVVDCTGHGVPGAMMSLIGDLLLNDVVNNQIKNKTPAEILNELHGGVVKTLKQNLPENKAADGMDVALCRIHKTTNEVLYSGAHRPLYHLQNEEIIQYKGCKFPIGGMQYNGENTFKDHSVSINKKDSIFFFSDGLPDQFGGPENLKYGPKRIRNLILESQHNSMTQIKDLFENSFYDWMGDAKQIDDVLLIGIKF